MMVRMRRPSEKEPLLTIPFTFSQTCNKGAAMDAYRVGRTSHRMCCACDRGRAGPEVAWVQEHIRHCGSILSVLCPDLIESINTSQPETEKFSETGIRPPELVCSTFVGTCVCVCVYISTGVCRFPFSIDWGLQERMVCSSRAFLSLWISWRPFKSQACRHMSRFFLLWWIGYELGYFNLLFKKGNCRQQGDQSYITVANIMFLRRPEIHVNTF